VAKGGQSLRGSGDFFAWADSLLYMRRCRSGLLATVEHRGAAAPQPVGLALAGDDVHLQIDTAITGDESSARAIADEPALDGRVIDALTHAGAPLSRATRCIDPSIGAIINTHPL
jgi:hypothetical protein